MEINSGVKGVNDSSRTASICGISRQTWCRDSSSRTRKHLGLGLGVGGKVCGVEGKLKVRCKVRIRCRSQ